MKEFGISRSFTSDGISRWKGKQEINIPAYAGDRCICVQPAAVETLFFFIVSDDGTDHRIPRHNSCRRSWTVACERLKAWP